MSNDDTQSEQIPAAPPPLPSAADTAKDIAACDELRTAQATAALKELIYRVMDAVHTVDASHDISAYLESMSLIVEGTGTFRLNIIDRNTGLDHKQLIEEAMESVASHAYHKTLRPFAIGADYDEQPAAPPGPDSKPGGHGDQNG